MTDDAAHLSPTKSSDHLVPQSNILSSLLAREEAISSKSKYCTHLFSPWLKEVDRLAMESSRRHEDEPQGTTFGRQPPSLAKKKNRRRRCRPKLSLVFWSGGILLSCCILFFQQVHVLQISNGNIESGNHHHLYSLAPPQSQSQSLPLTSKNASETTPLSGDDSKGAATTTTLRRHSHGHNQDKTTNTVTTPNNKSTTDYMRNVTGYFNPHIKEFERQEGVVIVTKIHDEAYLPMLEQMLCLLHQAYNHRVNYDIVVFTTEVIDPSLTLKLQRIVAPAVLTVVQDNRGSLQAEIANLTPSRLQQFAKDCNLLNSSSNNSNSNESTSSQQELLLRLGNLTWWSKCPDRLAYNWQAEFRSWHIWNHPALLTPHYRWMMWLDADAFCSKVWPRDPIAIALQHNLTILFDNFPKGHAGGREIQQRIQRAFSGKEDSNNDTETAAAALCHVKLSPLGHLVRHVNQDCAGVGKEVDGDDNVAAAAQVLKHKNNIPLIHGFFHITNMDFYRKHLYWAETLIGNGFLQRKFDDQIAVTVPAAYFTPQQSWLLRGVGVNLGVYHNGKLDGHFKTSDGGGFKRRWNKKGGKEEFPEAAEACSVVAGG